MKKKKIKNISTHISLFYCWCVLMMSGYWFARAVYSSALLIIVFPQIVENTFPFQLKVCLSPKKKKKKKKI